MYKPYALANPRMQEAFVGCERALLVDSLKIFGVDEASPRLQVLRGG
jgi:hypothetical protein